MPAPVRTTAWVLVSIVDGGKEAEEHMAIKELLQGPCPLIYTESGLTNPLGLAGWRAADIYLPLEARSNLTDEGWADCLGKICSFNSLTDTARKCSVLSQALFSISCCYSDNKTNHAKLGPTLSFRSQPTSPVVGTGLGWEAESG